MSLEDMIQLITDFAGPLGPLRSPSDQIAERNARIDAAPFDDISLLLELAAQPPVTSVSSENWETALVDTLATWGRRDPERLVEKISTPLPPGAGRGPIISALGGLRHEAALRILAPLSATAVNLSEDEVVRLVEALGEIGGLEARRCCEQVRSALPQRSGAVEAAIAKAIAATALSTAERDWRFSTITELDNRRRSAWAGA